MTNLPPQAYTRDTLVKAIEWLSSQPPSVRERATSADLMVSYYLQARRKNVAQMDAPISGEAFKSDLKLLAEDLKQFEDPSPPQGPPSMPTQSRSPSNGNPTVATPASSSPTWTIDSRSLAAARELQQRLNLGSEIEAIRMLITLGAEKARDLFG